MLPSTFKDYLLLHFIVLIWGVTSILGLLISLPSLELVFYRTLLAAIGVGVLISLHWIFFFWSAKVSTASVCLAGMATTSLWVVAMK